MRRLTPLILLAALIFAMVLWQRQTPTPTGVNGPVATAAGNSDHNPALPAFLPLQARSTLDAIARGGPFTHRQDGAVFGNYEGQLPKQARGFYHEYTVETPGASNRGTRRIITGGEPPVVYYYTDDHYRSFRRFEPSR